MLERFTEPAYRAPCHANDLLLRITQGCTWNRCHFCNMSREHQFLSVTSEELEEQLRYFADAYPRNTPIWFVGANPLVLPTATLLAHIALVRRYFPDFAAITLQTRVADVLHKRLSDLQRLRAAGLSEIFLGVESGDDETLRFINKGQSAAQALAAMRKLNEAEIALAPMYIIGGGGKGTAERNAIGTAELLNQVRCKIISTTGLTVFPGAPFWEMRERGELTEMPEYEKVQELLAFVEHYTGESFLYYLHYLNPLHFTASLPRDKAEIVENLRCFLREHTPEEVEELVNRQEKASI